jgi:hypothetical protein
MSAKASREGGLEPTLSFLRCLVANVSTIEHPIAGIGRMIPEFLVMFGSESKLLVHVCKEAIENRSDCCSRMDYFVN